MSKPRNFTVIRRLAYILLLVAGSVLVLHNLTPHVHSETDNVDLPASVGDWLEFAFSIDPGAGHLECFSEAQPVDMDNPEELFVAILPDRDMHADFDEWHRDATAILIYYGDPPDYRQMAPRPPPRFV